MNISKASFDASVVDVDYIKDDQFHYRPLNSAVKEIRLVTIQPQLSSEEDELSCSLIYTPLHDAPAYEALSYTRADDDEDSSLSSTITLDGHPFLVTNNLEAALRVLRLSSIERVFWVDAICIDQKNDPERSHQVGIMRMIYENAAEIAIWLGRETNQTQGVLNFLHEVVEHINEESWFREALQKPFATDLIRGVVSIFLRRYWDRIWTIQEVWSTSQRIVYCGSESISWETFTKARSHILSECHGISDPDTIPPFVIRVLISVGPRSLLINVKPTKNNHDLLDLLLLFRHKGSSDPRDKVYGIVGLTVARDDPEFIVDYSQSVSEIDKFVARYVVATTGSLKIISVGKGDFHPDWLPSWAPNAE